MGFLLGNKVSIFPCLFVLNTVNGQKHIFASLFNYQVYTLCDNYGRKSEHLMIRVGKLQKRDTLGVFDPYHELNW